MFYLCGADWRQHYRNNIKTKGAVLDFVDCEKIASCSVHFVFFSRCDNGFSWCETFIGSGFYLDKDDSPVGVDHNKVYFAGFAGEVASELFEALSFQKLFAAFFPPLAEQFPIGQQLASVQQHIVARGSYKSEYCVAVPATAKRLKTENIRYFVWLVCR